MKKNEIHPITYWDYLFQCQESVTVAEDIKPNSVHMALQIPQYFFITVGEVMFSVTGLEFSYSQVQMCAHVFTSQGCTIKEFVGHSKSKKKNIFFVFVIDNSFVVFLFWDKFFSCTSVSLRPLVTWKQCCKQAGCLPLLLATSSFWLWRSLQNYPNR